MNEQAAAQMMMKMNPKAMMMSMNQQAPPPPPQMMTQQQQPQQMLMMNRGGGGSYGMWPVQMHDPSLGFNQNPMSFPGFVPGSNKPLGRSSNNNNNWKGKKGINNNDKRRKGKSMAVGSSSGVGGGGGGYKPPTLKELQHENRLKARNYFQKKKFDGNNSNNNKFNNNRSGSYAPRNTSSFIIRAKRSGGIASLVSPCPVTPAVLPTPMFSPSREVLGDMAKEEWGVDGYGSMNGLIRLRSPGNDAGEDEEDEDGGSSESDVEEHLEVERRLDHDLSRFEMIYPSYRGEYNNVLENRVDDQDTHIAQVEEENLILKERLFLMERELGDLRRRLLSLERQHHVGDIIEEVVENYSDNDNESRGGGYSRSLEENEEVVQENNEEGNQYAEVKEGNNNAAVLVKYGNLVDAKEGNNNGDDDVKNTGKEEKKVGKDQRNEEVKDVEIKEEDNVKVMEMNNDDDVENKDAQGAKAMKMSTDVYVGAKEIENVGMLNDELLTDVCMEELAHNQDEVIAGSATLLGAQTESSGQ